LAQKRWRGRERLAGIVGGRQGGNFIVGGETNFLADGHFFALIVGGEAICSFLKEY